MKVINRNIMMAILVALGLSGLSVLARADDQNAAPALSSGDSPTNTPEIVAPPLQLEQPVPAEAKDKWTFTSPLLFWFPAMKGSITAGGRSADVDLSMSDIANHTDIGFVGYFDLSKDRYGVYVQPNYLKISGDAKSSGGTKASVETQLWIVETAAHYDLWEWKGDYHGSVAAVAGLRFWQIHNELTSAGSNFGGTKSLYDPLVGLRYQQYFTPKFHIWLQGDIGGFDLGQDTSRFAWQVWPLLGYDFTMPVIKKPSTVFAGYRLLDSQYHEGSGADERGYHLLFNGVTLGLNVMLF